MWVITLKLKIIEGEIELPEGATVHDAQGRIIAPGLVDLRVFTGEPGREYRETLKTASNAAAAGGVTSALIMPDTNPVLDDAALIDFVARRARDTAEINFYPAAAISKGLEGQEGAWFTLAEFDDLNFPAANQAIIDKLHKLYGEM